MTTLVLVIIDTTYISKQKARVISAPASAQSHKFSKKPSLNKAEILLTYSISYIAFP